jgi:hypothetical protein
MGLFGSISGGKSSSSSTTKNTPYSSTAAQTLMDLEKQGLDLTNLLKSNTQKQQDYLSSAYDQAGSNLTNLGDFSNLLSDQVSDLLSPEEAANKAETDVLSETAQAEDAYKRNMARYGINPAGFASNARSTALDTSKNIVGARSSAEETARNENYDKILQAIDATNQVLSQLMGYDSTGTLMNAMSTTGNIAQAGLTPKTTSSKGTTRTISGGLGYKGD